MRTPIVAVAALLVLWTSPASAQSSKKTAFEVPDSVLFEKGITYTSPEGQDVQLDLAMPKERARLRPAVICIHGGGFRAGNREGYDPLIVRLATRGYVAVTVSYRWIASYMAA